MKLPSFSSLRSRFRRSWPQGIPKLYKGPPEEIVPFLDRKEFERLQSLRRVQVMPDIERVDRGSPVLAACSHLLIRNLMLLPDLSVLGPEDTRDATAGADPRSLLEDDETLVVLSAAHQKVNVVWYHRDAEGTLAMPMAELQRDPGAALAGASRWIASQLGAGVPGAVEAAWRAGQPSDVESLKRHGELMLRSAPGNQVVETAWRKDPANATILWQLEDEPYPVDVLLAGFEQDPHNAQLCFLLFCAVWESGGFEPWAVQYCRKAVELAPGHGKAHMCVPHAAPDLRSLLAHSELAVQFLPRNAFAASNYFSNLTKWGYQDERTLRLAALCIELDPENPDGYQQLIRQLTAECRFAEARQVAASLCELYSPPMAPRTRYSLSQNPVTAERLERGWNPYPESVEDLERLDLLARCGEIV